MYLIDTNVLAEARKKEKAHPGVVAFFERASAREEAVYLSVVSVGELRRGVESIRRRGDTRQAEILDTWLNDVLEQCGDNILDFDADSAQVWGKPRVPHAEHELDKQIAAIAWVNRLTVVTRNTAGFAGTGVALKNPFLPI